jgi:hypothetical protein
MSECSVRCGRARQIGCRAKMGAWSRKGEDLLRMERSRNLGFVLPIALLRRKICVVGWQGLKVWNKC